MPSLRPGTPGAKEAFGVSIMNEHAAVVIPPAAMQHYDLQDGSEIMLATGRRHEPGFAVMNKERAENSVFNKILQSLEQENKLYWQNDKAYVLTRVQKNTILFSEEMLTAFHLQIGMRLMSVKSTTVSLSFTAVEIWAAKLNKQGFADAAANIAKLPVFG